MAAAPILQLSSALLFLLLLVKAYAIAGYSLTTTGELVSTAPVQVLLGTIASYEYFLFPVLVLVGFAMLRSDVAERGEWARVAGIGVVAVAFLLSPPQYLALIAVGAWVWSRLGALAAERAPSLHFKGAFESYIVFVVLVFVVRTLDQPWVPAEVLTLRSPAVVDTSGGVIVREDEPVAYVLRTGDWVIALNADTRFVMKIPAGDVEERTICHHAAQLGGTRPVLDYVIGRRYDSPNTSCERLVGRS